MLAFLSVLFEEPDGSVDLLQWGLCGLGKDFGFFLSQIASELAGQYSVLVFCKLKSS